MSTPLQYGDYLQLEKILDAQLPESNRRGQPAHDEMLFIVIHQSYELWFKQLLFEVESVIEIMKGPSLNDNSPELQTIVHRFGRCTTILKVLVHQIDVLETMTAMDFLDFRDWLRPASGFQSWQFKLLEARLGLEYGRRHGQQYYLSQLQQTQIDLIRKAENEKSLLQWVNSWLERMPFFEEAANWTHFRLSPGLSPQEGVHVFWSEYRERYRQSLAEAEQGNLRLFDSFFISGSPSDGPDENSGPRTLSLAASRSALFILLYRGYPILQLPFQLLHQLLEIDEQLSTWRYRHMNMVHRMIGSRIGTGGSQGKDYLQGTVEKHYIFSEIAGLSSFLIERKKLPSLSGEMEKRLGFVRADKVN
jgi:tryptophan 2,3-dioxygenase